jgi:hypothetical protein
MVICAIVLVVPSTFSAGCDIILENLVAGALVSVVRPAAIIPGLDVRAEIVLFANRRSYNLKEDSIIALML